MDTFWTQRFLKHPYPIEHKAVPVTRNVGQLTLKSVGLDASKPLITKIKTGNGSAKHTHRVRANILYAIDFKDGERGRNRTYNLLIKSHNSIPSNQQDSPLPSANSGKVLQNPQPRRNKKTEQKPEEWLKKNR
jgi:hypothetical protein